MFEMVGGASLAPAGESLMGNVGSSGHENDKITKSITHHP